MGDHAVVELVLIAAVGLGIGFLGGLFGKGGAAVATPLLAAIGVPPLVALAAPLPATVPSTLAASAAYWRERLIDWRVLRWSVGFGAPATITGALVTSRISGDALVAVTDVLLVGLGLRFVLAPAHEPEMEVLDEDGESRLRLAVVAVAVGFLAGLLANSGGFLLAPLYIAVVRLPIKRAFASSLAAGAALALPGTLVHWALGHIDWRVVAVFAATSVPLSFVGARVAIRTDAARLERAYGAVILVVGATFLVARARSI